MYRPILTLTTVLFLALPVGLQGQAMLQTAVGGGAFTGDDYENVEAGFSIGGGLL